MSLAPRPESLGTAKSDKEREREDEDRRKGKRREDFHGTLQGPAVVTLALAVSITRLMTPGP